MRDDGLRKYPRTHHVAGSRLQPGDEDLDAVPFTQLAGKHLVVEEKVDGANAGLSFDDGGALRLQSRGHYLTGGPRERHFALFKGWAHQHQAALRPALGSRYVLYGEWLYAKHTVFYDALPHYFMEFDVLDRETDRFLSTARRRRLLRDTPLAPVRVLHEGPLRDRAALQALLGPSAFKTEGHAEALRESAEKRELDVERTLRETDPSPLMEGLYIKVEDGDHVVARYKFIRASFLTAVQQSEGHWLDRPILPNQLAAGVDLEAPRRYGDAP